MEVPARAGRIVREIQLDDVRINYQKNALEYDTPDWKRVVRTLRGEGPLLPERARELNYPTNAATPAEQTTRPLNSDTTLALPRSGLQPREDPVAPTHDVDPA